MENDIISKDIGKLRMNSNIICNNYKDNKDTIYKHLGNNNVEEYLILTVLIQDSYEKMYLKDISERLEISRTELSKIVLNLEAKGYVEWTHDDCHNGSSYILLTEYGRKSYELTEQRLESNIIKLTEKYSKAELRRFILMMKDITETLKKAE